MLRNYVYCPAHIPNDCKAPVVPDDDVIAEFDNKSPAKDPPKPKLKQAPKNKRIWIPQIHQKSKSESKTRNARPRK